MNMHNQMTGILAVRCVNEIAALRYGRRLYTEV